MSSTRIEIAETGVRIVDLEISKKDVVDFLRRVPESERESALVQAIEVGVFCLERARTGQDLDFVRRQVELLITTVQSAVAKIPEETQKALAAKIGADEGQVLAPVQHLVTDVTSAAREKIKEIRVGIWLHGEFKPSFNRPAIAEKFRAPDPRLGVLQVHIGNPS